MNPRHDAETNQRAGVSPACGPPRSWPARRPGPDSHARRRSAAALPGVNCAAMTRHGMVISRPSTPSRGVAQMTTPNQRARISQLPPATSTPESSSRHTCQNASGAAMPATAATIGRIAASLRAATAISADVSASCLAGGRMLNHDATRHRAKRAPTEAVTPPLGPFLPSRRTAHLAVSLPARYATADILHELPGRRREVVIMTCSPAFSPGSRPRSRAGLNGACPAGRKPRRP